MIRTVTIITVAAFVLSLICLSVAVSIAGPELISEGAWGGAFSHFRFSGGHHSFTWSNDASNGETSNREQAWTGEALDVDVPASVRFTQADGPAKLVVHGPKEALDHLVVSDGHVRFDRTVDDADDVTLELTAPKVTRFALNGSGKLDISGYRQDSLDLRITGDGDAIVRGVARSVKLDLSGSGNADLGSLATEDADVRISGSGQARVGPKTSARLDISGSGGVTLLSHPKSVESHLTGSGSIDQQDGDDTPAPPAKPAKRAKPGTTV
jgi:hypothetical protein